MDGPTSDLYWPTSLSWLLVAVNAGILLPDSIESPVQFLCLTSNFLFILHSFGSQVLRNNKFIGYRKVALNRLPNLNYFYLVSTLAIAGFLDSFAKPGATFKNKTAFLTSGLCKTGLLQTSSLQPALEVWGSMLG